MCCGMCGANMRSRWWCSFRSRWGMFPGETHQLAQVDHTGAIQLQGLNCRTTCRRQPKHVAVAFIPTEVIRPSLPAWVKDRRFTSIHRVGSGHPLMLAGVASRTGQGQVVQFGTSAQAQWNDMIDIEGLGCIRHLALAVLTASLRPPYDPASNVQGNVCSSHQRNAEPRAGPSTHPMRCRAVAPTQSDFSASPRQTPRSGRSIPSVLRVPCRSDSHPVTSR